MRVIEVHPCKKFKGAWVACEAPGVEPAFATPDPMAAAIRYARTRFGGFPAGEIHVYDDSGENIAETIKIDGGTQYGPV